MSERKSTKPSETRVIEELLRKHFPDHPPAYPPKAYRYNSASIRVRVVSARFAGMDWFDRSDLVYDVLKKGVPEDTLLDIMMILPLAPNELADSPANYTFEHPTPSTI